LVGDIELGEAYLASLGNPWNLLIEQFRPCQLAKKDHLLPHQSVIKSIFFQQLTPHVGNIIFNRFKQLFGGHFPPDEDLLEASECIERDWIVTTKNRNDYSD
jgi:DNA-3-methyladenine glycosylase II